MIHLTSDSQILVETQAVDFRKGIDGLVALCQQNLHQDASSGTLFVFINRARTMIRLLAYEQNGYWLMTKRLSKGRYSSWPKSHRPINKMQAIQLRQLLSGLLTEPPQVLSHES